MMKIKLLLCAAVLFLSIQSYSIIQEVNPADFNISPSNKNNTAGFLKLSTWIKGKKDLVINFKPGIYYIGEQKKSLTRVVENIDNIFSVTDCTNIKINGKGATVKYVDRLKYGSFDVKTKEKLNTGSNFYKGEHAAYPGNFIHVNRSKQITITGFELDGNSGNLIIGGKYGDNGIQLFHRGIYVTHSFDVILNNLYIHHFGLDGIEISNSSLKAGASKYQAQILNVKSMYNGRQGVSWTGGNGLYINNSEFSYTGQGKIISPPGCGIDIEPEVNKCINGLFTNCKFEHNTGYAFGTDFFKLKIENILFQKCTFGGTNGGALFVSNGGVTIDNCLIYGQIVRPSGLSVHERVVIKNSTIYDHHPKNLKITKFQTNHLIDAGGHRTYFDFINCDIYIRKVKLCYIETGVADEKDMPTFRNNRVYYIENNYIKKDFIALFRGVIVDNNTFKINFNESENNGNFLHTGSNVIVRGQNIITGNTKFIGWNSSNGPKILKRQ